MVTTAPPAPRGRLQALPGRAAQSPVLSRTFRFSYCPTPKGRSKVKGTSLPPSGLSPPFAAPWLAGSPPVQTPRGLPAASTKCGVRRALAQYGRSAGLRRPLLCGLGRPVTCEQHSPAGGGCAGPLSASRGQRLGCAPALGVWGAERLVKASNFGPPGVCFLGPQVGPGAA